MNRTGKALTVVGALLFGAGAAVTLVELAETPEASVDPMVGQPAPAISLRSVRDGETRSLASLSGKVVLVDFWATFCEPCRRSMPELEHLIATLPASDFAVLSVNVDEPAEGRSEEVLAFLDRNHLSFDVLLDNGRTAWAYHALRIPRLVLVDREGVVVDVFQGLTESRRLEDALEAAIARGL